LTDRSLSILLSVVRCSSSRVKSSAGMIGIGGAAGLAVVGERLALRRQMYTGYGSIPTA
jgi:hypothetical protein